MGGPTLYAVKIAHADEQASLAIIAPHHEAGTEMCRDQYKANDDPLDERRVEPGQTRLRLVGEEPTPAMFEPETDVQATDRRPDVGVVTTARGRRTAWGNC